MRKVIVMLAWVGLMPAWAQAQTVESGYLRDTPSKDDARNGGAVSLVFPVAGPVAMVARMGWVQRSAVSRGSGGAGPAEFERYERSLGFSGGLRLARRVGRVRPSLQVMLSAEREMVRERTYTWSGENMYGGIDAGVSVSVTPRVSVYGSAGVVAPLAVPTLGHRYSAGLAVSLGRQ